MDINVASMTAAAADLSNRIWMGQQSESITSSSAILSDENSSYFSQHPNLPVVAQADTDNHQIFSYTDQSANRSSSVGAGNSGFLAAASASSHVQQPPAHFYSHAGPSDFQSQVLSELQQHHQQLLLQQQQNTNLLLQQQQQQQDQQVTSHEGEMASVNGQFKVAPITDPNMCLQEHFLQQQQQIALQTQLQMQYQLQQQHHHQQQQHHHQQQMLQSLNNMLLQNGGPGIIQLAQNFQQSFQQQGMVMVDPNGAGKETLDEEPEEEEDLLDQEHSHLNLNDLGLTMQNEEDEEEENEIEEEDEVEVPDRTVDQEEMVDGMQYVCQDVEPITILPTNPSTQVLAKKDECDSSDNSRTMPALALQQAIQKGEIYYQNGEINLDNKTEEQQQIILPQLQNQLQMSHWQQLWQQQEQQQHQQMQQIQIFSQPIMENHQQQDVMEIQSQNQEEFDPDSNGNMWRKNKGRRGTQIVLLNQAELMDYIEKNGLGNEGLDEIKLAANNTGRKIVPVRRPGLVLKTPIAYQGNVDPSKIPIQKEGMAVCERCGAIGVKHSFYTKHKSFCSISCARNYETDSLKKSGGIGGGTCENSGDNTVDLASKRLDRRKYFAKMNMMELMGGHSNSGSSSDENMSHINMMHCLTDSNNERTLNYLYNNANLKNNSNNVGIRGNVLYRDLMPQEELPALVAMPVICPEEDRIETVNRRKIPSEILNTYDWSKELRIGDFAAAPVTCFRHAPGYEIWNKVVIGMKVEVENTDCDNNNQAASNVPHSFWVASVLRIQGYKALLRYEGFDNDDSHDFWVNLCSSEVHHVGWCATRGKPLIPPKSIETKYSDWKSFLMDRLYNARTLPSSFYNKLSETFKSRFRVGMQLEIVDKDKISHVKLATIEHIVGKRLHVRYNDNSDGFCCHEDSSLIHHVGWAVTVGHKISAPAEYMERILAGQDLLIKYQEDDATVELFRMNFTYEEYFLSHRVSGFEEGMKLEAIDPLNPSSICVASVMSVLKFGYMMIRIDVYEPLVYGDDWFCYHEKSPYIFPVGFCHKNQIDLTPPKGYDTTTFDWESYLDSTQSVAATEDLFHRDVPKHSFKAGMKVECADLMDPSLVCVATVSKVVGRLLRINFDGWEEMYDQWLDVESPDMYPVGWCFLVKHRLEGPPVPARNIKPPQKLAPAKGRRGKQKKLKAEQSSTDKQKPGPKKGKGRPGKTSLSSQLSEGDSVPDNEFLTYASQQSQEVDEDFDDDEFDQETNTSEQTSFTVSDVMAAESGGSPIAHAVASSQSVTQKRDEDNPPNAKIPRISLNESSSLQEMLDDDEEGEEEQEDVQADESTEIERCLEDWTVDDVGVFLRSSDCGSHCEAFMKNSVDGKRLLVLSKDEIIQLLGMKVGPALKIFDLIQQIKDKMDPISSRRKKFL